MFSRAMHARVKFSRTAVGVGVGVGVGRGRGVDVDPCDYHTSRSLTVPIVAKR
jgi:hypothetical protein